MATQPWEQTQPLARRWGHTLAAELRFLFAALSAPPLYMALVLLALALLLIPQLPLRYRIDVGVGEGYGGDLPMLQGFNTPEQDSHGSFRWTADGAQIHVAGLGQRPLRVQLDFFPISDEVVQAGPKSLDILANGAPLVTLPVFKAGSQQSFVVPSRMLASGELTLTLRTETFAPPGDPRRLGTPLDRVTITALNNGGFAAPDWRSLSTWLLALGVGWLVLCRAIGQTGDGRPETDGGRPEPIREGREGETQYAVRSTQYAVMLLGTSLIALAAALDPLRWAAGAQAALVALAWAYGLALLLHWLLPGLAARLAVPLGGRALGVLVLVCVGAFALRYGGRLYPESMPGDIGFHTNRFGELVRGLVHILSRNRGVDFPYPPGPYLLLAPFTLLGVSIPTLLQFAAALVDALSPVLIYTLVALGLTSRDLQLGNRDSKNRELSRKGREAREVGTTQSSIVNRQSSISIALLAAAIYVFTPAGLMTTWWSFSTHIFSQFFALLLVTGTMVLWTGVDRRPETGDRRPQPPPSPPARKGEMDSTQHAVRSTQSVVRSTLILAVLLSFVFLGHFGFFINTALLFGGALALAWLASWRGLAWAQRLRWPVSLAYGGALLFGLAFFYSAYVPIFLEQARVAADGGLSAVAQRAPVTRAMLLEGLWEAGMVQHFGFFPLALALGSLWLLPRWKPHGEGLPANRWLLFWLMLGTFGVSATFAVVPFITLATNSTRWLMFSAWAVAVGAALVTHWLWQRGRAGRLVVLLMAGYIIWLTALTWLGPMLWRIRPPEPF